MERDEIGEVGQDLFKTWCSQARITAIPASKDKHGWDFFLQLKVPGGRHDAPERSCKVQVKTTSTDDPAADIKLSNWERMAKERVPWFVLHIVLDDVEPREAYLLHIDEQEVMRVLRRLREFHDAPEQIHQVRMSATPRETDALAQPFHDDLRRRIIAALGASEDEYVSKKADWIKKSGYETRPFTYTVSMRAPDEAALMTQLAEWSVGLIESLPIAAIQVVETRFGITLPFDEMESGEGEIKFLTLPSLGTTTITLSDRDRSEQVALSCSTHLASAILPFLPPRYERLRFVSPFIEFLRYPKDETTAVFHTRFNIPSARNRLALSELAKACKALRLLSNARTNGLRAELCTERGIKQTTDLSSYVFDLDAEFERFDRVVEATASIVASFGLDGTTECVPQELLEQDFQIKLMAAAFDRSVVGWELRVGVPSTGPDAQGKRAALVLPTVVHFEKVVLAACVAMVGTADWSRVADGTPTIAIRDPEVRICSRRVVPASEWGVASIEQAREQIAEQLVADGVEIVVS